MEKKKKSIGKIILICILSLIIVAFATLIIIELAAKGSDAAEWIKTNVWNVDDFIKKSSVIYYSKEALERDSKSIQLFANNEGLTAHANSIKVRFE